MLKRPVFLVYILTILSLNADGQTKLSYLSSGDKAFAKEDYSSALGFYLQSMEFDEDDAYLMMQVGECNRLMFEYKTALAWLNKCQAADKKHQYPDALLYKAELLKCMAAFDDARAAVSFYLALDEVHHRAVSDVFLRNINSAEDIFKHGSDSVALNSCGKNINTAFSDFAAIYANDSTMLFSSLRFESTGSKKKNLISKILTATIDSFSTGKSKILEDIINNPSWHNCNASITPDGKLMVFSRCNYDGNNKLICALYESRFLNGQWQEPVRLNDELNKTDFTSTQPCITSSGIKGYILFFVTDQPGGAGRMDICRSKRDARGNYTKPENCDSHINTPGNEYSPFYNTATGDLYFSSDSLNGLGGLDIYKINLKDSTSRPINIGLPYNSGYNDLYFSMNINKSSSGFLSSNRPGALELYGQTCCYDIFYFSPSQKEPEQKISEEVIPSKTTVSPTPLHPLEISADEADGLFRDYLPLKLYFDNDYPDPRSRKSTTNANYESLYQNYFSKLENYINGFSLNRSERADDARAAVEHFFASDLQFNHRQLEKFSVQMLEILKNGNNVNITIRGCASPLAESSYNLILSHRRINSMINFWNQWKDGALKSYFESGKIKILEEAAGESLSTDVVSDRLNDLANSVYNPSASRERRIEIISVNVSKP